MLQIRYLPQAYSVGRGRKRFSTPGKQTGILIISHISGSPESNRHPSHYIAVLEGSEMKERELSDNEKNRPLASFLMHGLIVTIGFAVLGGMVIYWVA